MVVTWWLLAFLHSDVIPKQHLYLSAFDPLNYMSCAQRRETLKTRKNKMLVRMLRYVVFL